MSGSPVPPASFEPLDGRNGLPGDADAVSDLARRYANTAAEIETQAANLTRLTSQARGGWRGEAGEKFADKAGDLAERIGKAEGRYAAAADALGYFGDRLAALQTTAYDAVRRAQTAKADGDRLQSSPPARPGATATPEEVLVADDERRTHQLAVENASTRYAEAKKDYDDAKAEYESAARTAADKLRRGRHDDGLKDSWWDRNAGWIKTALAVIGAVVLVLAIAALVITLFIPGLNVLVGGVLLSTILNGIGAGLGVLMLGGHTAMWLSGNGELSDVLWDLAGLATFGLGFVVGKVARGLASAASRTGSGIAASRAGRGAFSGRGLPSVLYDLGRVPLGRPVLSLSPRIRETFAAADAAASAGASRVATLSGRPTTFTNRLLAFGDAELSELGTLVSRINQTVPDSARLAVLTGLFRTVELGGSALPSAGLLIQSGFDVHKNLVVEPAEARQDALDRPQIVQQWSMPQMHVR